jgi:hypothetical protein
MSDWANACLWFGAIFGVMGLLLFLTDRRWPPVKRTKDPVIRAMYRANKVMCGAGLLGASSALLAGGVGALLGW